MDQFYKFRKTTIICYYFFSRGIMWLLTVHHRIGFVNVVSWNTLYFYKKTHIKFLFIYFVNDTHIIKLTYTDQWFLFRSSFSDVRVHDFRKGNSAIKV